MTDGPHQLRCWDCGNVVEHKDSITPWMACAQCGSRDTRRMKTVELFTVGRLHDPQPEEMLSPFRQLSLAEERARRRADIDEKDVIAIWNQNSEVIAVYTAGMKLEPVK